MCSSEELMKLYERQCNGTLPESEIADMSPQEQIEEEKHAHSVAPRRRTASESEPPAKRARVEVISIDDNEPEARSSNNESRQSSSTSCIASSMPSGTSASNRAVRASTSNRQPSSTQSAEARSVSTITQDSIDRSGRFIHWTKVAHCDNYLPNTLTFAQCLGRHSTLRRILVITYTYDHDFLWRYVSNSSATIQVVKSWSTQDGEEEGVQRVSGTFSVVHPPLPKAERTYPKVHSKLYIMEHDSYVRVLISSANCDRSDWMETCNTIWFQDFARQSTAASTSSTKFGDDLRAFLLAFKYIDVEFLDQFDFAEARARLVATVPGGHASNGLAQLSSAVADLNPPESTELAVNELLLQSASLGRVQGAFYNEILDACVGKVAEHRRGARVRVLFPTLEEVLRIAAPGAERLFLAQSFVAQLPRALLHRVDACVRANLHSKCIVRRWRAADATQSGAATDHFWMYCGSHNLSVSAWSRANRVAVCYELGVVLSDGIARLTTEELRLRLAFSLTPRAYERTDVAWIQQNEQMFKEYESVLRERFGA